MHAYVFDRPLRAALLVLLSLLAYGFDANRIQNVVDTLPPGTRASILLQRLDDGRPLFRHHSQEQRRLASVTKLFVSAAALLELGPDHRMYTRVYRLGPVVDGSVPGLLIHGGGSPCLDEHFTNGDPEAIFRDWITQLREMGIRRIDGPVLVDGSLFSGPAKPPTYPQDHSNQIQWYSAPASAFAWLDNCIEVQVRPNSPGKAALVLLRPNSPRIELDNQAMTVTKAKRHMLITDRATSSNRISVRGEYDRATAWFPMAIHDQPNLLHGDHFCYLLQAADISAPRQCEPGVLSDHPQAELVIERVDHLGPAIDILNQRSQNFYGEQILRLLGVARSGTGSISTGTDALTAILNERAGLDPDAFTILDGSGLSYGNMASADSVVQLLHALAGSDLAGVFRSSLKEMDVGRHQAQVKTGTLAVARCLAGYFRSSGGNHAFAILLDRERPRGGWLTQAKQAYEDILAAMIEATGA